MNSAETHSFLPCDILLPRSGYEQFAVQACDQFTSDPEYWERVDRAVGVCPSALRFILPEVYLGSEDIGRRLRQITSSSENYLRGDIFSKYENSYILTKRTFGSGATRVGLVGALNLLNYNYEEHDKLIAASEQTVPDRLPPRIEVLNAQKIETSHVIALLDDIGKTVIEPLLSAGLPKLYDFSLMENGGRIQGFRVAGSAAAAVSEAIEALGGTPRIVIGDGNHSIAASKKIGRKFALAELCNIYDDGITFGPIHRVVFGTERPAVIKLDRNIAPYSALVARVDDLIDKIKHETVDYIHGESEARAVASQAHNATAIIMPPLEKSALFETVRTYGKFPRKSFSIGDAEEKRYYLECKIPQ